MNEAERPVVVLARSALGRPLTQGGRMSVKDGQETLIGQERLVGRRAEMPVPAVVLWVLGKLAIERRLSSSGAVSRARMRSLRSSCCDVAPARLAASSLETGTGTISSSV